MRNREGKGGMMKMNNVNGIDEIDWKGGIEDEKEGNGIGIGKEVNGESKVIERGLKMRRSSEEEIEIEKMIINVVGKDKEMRMEKEKVGKRIKLGLSIGREGRVGGRVEDEKIGIRCDRILEIGRGKIEIVLNISVEEKRGEEVDGKNLRVDEKIGGGNDELVEGVKSGNEGVEKNMIEEGEEDGMLRIVVEEVLKIEIGEDGMEKLRDEG